MFRVNWRIKIFRVKWQSRDTEEIPGTADGGQDTKRRNQHGKINKRRNSSSTYLELVNLQQEATEKCPSDAFLCYHEDHKSINCIKVEEKRYGKC